MKKRQEFTNLVLRGRQHLADGGPLISQTASPTDSVGGQIGALNAQQNENLGSSIASVFTPQSNFYAQLAPTQQFDYSGLLSGAGQNAFNTNPYQMSGLNTIGLGSQGLLGLGNQALLNSTGQGAPSVAQTQLAQTTGQNVGSTAALIGGARGVSANAGLAARNIANAGASVQQQAVGQAAQLRAQEMLNQQQLADQAYQGAGQLGYNQVQGAVGSQNANTNLIGTTGGLVNSQNANMIQNYGNAQGINATTAQANAAANQKTAGNFLSGAGAALALLNQGGEVDAGAQYPIPVDNLQYNQMMSYDQGGQVAGPNSIVGKFMSSQEPSDSISQNDSSGLMSMLGGSMAQGGRVKAMVSPGEIVLSRSEASSPKQAAQIAASKARSGQKVGGTPKVKGDSVRNDTVPMDLESGGIVVKRTKASSPKKAAEFAYRVAMNKRSK